MSDIPLWISRGLNERHRIVAQTLTEIRMASSEIQDLLAPPSSESAVQKTVNLLDSRFTSLDQLDELESAVLQAQNRCDDLQEKVCTTVVLFTRADQML